MDRLLDQMRILGSRYELGRLLGSGGMARVYEAADRVLERRVAVKLVRAGLAADAGVRERLLREARAAARFTHPNVVAVYDVGEDDGEPYIVMEFVDGRTLAQELSERAPLPVGDALHRAAGVLAALTAAHERGLVHRDVKPGNVLLTDDGFVKLADFGIAKGLDDAIAGLTATGQILGTPRYLAPERVTGNTATPQSDLYAVGVLLYEMLSGSPPFDGEQSFAIALAHQREPVPPLEEAEPSVPPWLARVVHRALEKDPAERYPSAAAMAQDLRSGGAATTDLLPAGTEGETPAHPAAAASAHGGAAGGTRGMPVGVLAAAVGLVVVAGILAATLGDSPQDDEAAAGTGTEAAVVGTPADEPEPTAEPVDPQPAGPTAEPAEEPPAEPAGEAQEPERSPAEALAAFAATLADDPDAAGEKGEDLVEDIEEVLEEQGLERRTEARELMNEIDEWVRDGELDPEVGQEALALLEALAREPVDGQADSGGDGGDQANGPPGPDGQGPPGQRGRSRGRGR